MDIIRSKHRRGSAAYVASLLVWLIPCILMAGSAEDWIWGSLLLVSGGVLLLGAYLLRWGPVLPCMLLGFGVAQFQPAINRPAYSGISDLLVWGIVGAVFGLAWARSVSVELKDSEGGAEPSEE